MSRSYAPTELKRRLKPALEELEQLGFLEPLSAEERYSYVKRGTWRIILIRGSAAGPGEGAPQPPSELADALKARGVTSKTASDLVSSHPPGRIQTKIEVFDWLMKNEDKRVGKNPAGYLVASIRSDYKAPGDFPNPEAPSAESKSRTKAAEVDAAKTRARTERVEAEQVESARQAELRAAWDALADGEREEILASVKADNPGLSRWRKMLDPLCLSALEARLKGARQKTLFDAD